MHPDLKTPCLLFFLLFAALLGHAQVENYARVRLSGSAAAFEQAILAGLSLDHSHADAEGRVAELSASEIALARQSGLHITTEIADLSTYYAERAAKDLQTLSARSSGTTPLPPGFQLGNMGGFLTLDQVYQELDSLTLNYPQLVTRRDTIGTTHEGRGIWMIKISDNPDLDETEPKVFLNALHHAREPISMMQLIYFLQHILDQYGQDPMITHLINERELYVVPVVNPDGYAYNQVANPNGGGMWRKNRYPNGAGAFGVDLNRNYSYAWGHDNLGSSNSPTSNSYRGTGPFSERETQAILHFCQDRPFATGFSYHGYGEYYVHPWGYDPAAPLAQQPYYAAINPSLFDHNHYYPGNATETVDYPANGVFDDWMVGDTIAKARGITFSPEVGNTSDGFWPLPSRIAPLCAQQVSANLRILRLAGPCIDLVPLTPAALGGSPLSIDFRLINQGLETQPPFRATFVSGDPAILSASAPVNLNTLASRATFDAAFQLSIAPGTPAGTLISGEIQLELAPGLITGHPISFRYAVPQTLLFDGAELGTANWSGSWATSTERAFTGMQAFTDSPFAPYGPFANATYSLIQPIDLSDYLLPVLSFKTLWNIDHATDYVQVEASEDGLNYQPLAGRLSWEGAAPGQPAGMPLYEGRRYDWQEERIDLSGFTGKHLYLRFSLHSNSWREREGFYFDDITVTAYAKPITALPPTLSLSARLAPNPSAGTLRLVADPAAAEAFDIQVLDLTGRSVWTGRLTAGQTLSLTELARGTYRYRIQAAGVSSPWQALVLH